MPRRTARCCRRPGSTFLDRHSPTVGYTMLEELDSSENPRFLCSWTLRRVVISARCAVTSIFIAIARTTPIGKLSLTAITSLSKPSLGIPQRYRRKPKQLSTKAKDDGKRACQKEDEQYEVQMVLNTRTTNYTTFNKS